MPEGTYGLRPKTRNIPEKYRSEPELSTWKTFETFENLSAFKELDKWLGKKIRLHEAKEILSYDSSKDADSKATWVVHDEASKIQEQPKTKPKVRLIENVITGELWELVEPSEYSKGRFICLGKSPFSTPKDTN